MRVLLFITLLASLVLLSACETSTQLSNSAKKGMANMATCPEIEAAFLAYERDKQSFSALKQIAELSGYSIDNINADKASSYYEQIKQSANLARMLQGCTPL